jgi:hypothetical protein
MNFTPGLFGYNQGWRVNQHPRLVIDLNSDGVADIIGFGDAGIWTAIGKGDGTFNDAVFVQANLGVQQGERVDRHPRLAANLGQNAVGVVAFDALRRQYPDYVAALEVRFLRQSAVRQETGRYQALFEEGLIPQELFEDLKRGVAAMQAAMRHLACPSVRDAATGRNVEVGPEIDEQRAWTEYRRRCPDRRYALSKRRLCKAELRRHGLHD